MSPEIALDFERPIEGPKTNASVARPPVFTVASAEISAEVPTILDLTFFGAAGTDLFTNNFSTAEGASNAVSKGSDSTPFLTPTTFKGIEVPESNLSKSILHEAFDPDTFPNNLLLSRTPSLGATR